MTSPNKPTQDDATQTVVWGVRAIHQELRQIRMTLQWLLAIAIAGVIVGALIAFGAVELTTTLG